MQRKKHASPENHERWLVSYADFITLLFAFFVVMFASSQTDKAHAKAVSEAIKKALDNGALQTQVAAILGGSADKTEKGNAMLHGPGGARTKLVQKDANPLEAVPLTSPMKVLTDNLREEIAAGNIHLKLEARGLVIGLQTAAFFPSGGDGVAADAYPTIAKLAAVLNKVPNSLRLEGHTDSIPINTARFQSNWSCRRRAASPCSACSTRDTEWIAKGWRWSATPATRRWIRTTRKKAASGTAAWTS